MIDIEIVYSSTDSQIILSLKVENNTTIAQAIELSKIIERFPEINFEFNRVGIFGKLTKLATVLRNKDRVEIYRPLLNDPKEIRRRKAAQLKKLKKE